MGTWRGEVFFHDAFRLLCSPKKFCHRKVSNLNFKCFRLHTRTTLPTPPSVVSLGSVSSTSLMSSGKNRQVNLNIMLSLSMMILFDICQKSLNIQQVSKKAFFSSYHYGSLQPTVFNVPDFETIGAETTFSDWSAFQTFKLCVQ